MNEFEKYKQLKQVLDIEHKGIKLNRVLAVQIWQMANGKKISSWKFCFYPFFCINIRRLVFYPDKHTVLSTFGRYARRDHLELYQNVLKKLGEKVSYNNTMELGRKICFHPMIILSIIYKVFNHLAQEKYGVIQKMKIAVYFVYYINMIEELEKMDFSHVKKYLSMCSVLDLENLLTQYMKNKSIPTYSLQEGVYHIFNINPTLGSIQYENFETDHLLCWGEYSADEDAKFGIPREKLLVAGYPKNVKISRMKNGNVYKKAAVLLADKAYQNSNIRLLEILTHFSYKYNFFLKLHPASNLDFYRGLIDKTDMILVDTSRTINEFLNNDEFDFAIAVNTTAYYEALMRGIPCLRFSDGDFDMMAGYDDVFSNADEYQKHISEIKEKDIDAYQREIDSIIKYVMGYGIDNYKAIIMS